MSIPTALNGDGKATRLDQGSRPSVSLLLILLLAVWWVGLFSRGYWRPDEPREAALVHSMVVDPERTLPALAGETFAEKPPLTYWLAARSVDAFGPSPGAVRAPQLLYSVAAFLAIIALGRAMAGNAAGLTAGMAFVTFGIVYQTQIWLACDALVIAGVCVAMLGMFRGLTAMQSRPRLLGYLLMHVGLTAGFFSKNLAAWLVPASAFISFVLWERRPRELLRWEFWAGSLIPIACIAAWVLAVAAGPDGSRDLRVLFWNNLVGRFLPISAVAKFSYSDAHRNWPGKYFVEMFAYLIPWTVVAFAAARHAWSMSRRDTPGRPAWRFAVCASLPSLLVLSVATTARGIYAAPSLIGLALLIGLWVTDEQVRPSQSTGRILAWSGVMVAAVSCLLLAATLAAAIWVDRRVSAISLISLAATAAGLLTGLKIAGNSRITSPAPGLYRLGLAYALVISLGVLEIFSTVNRWQDLSGVAASIEEVVGRQPLVLWNSDETTLAMAELYFTRQPARIFNKYAIGPFDDADALAAYLDGTPDAHVLMLVPGHRWRGSEWIDFLRSGTIRQAYPSNREFGQFTRRTRLGVEKYVEQAGGRAYLLLRRPAAAHHPVGRSP